MPVLLLRSDHLLRRTQACRGSPSECVTMLDIQPGKLSGKATRTTQQNYTCEAGRCAVSILQLDSRNTVGNRCTPIRLICGSATDWGGSLPAAGAVPSAAGRAAGNHEAQSAALRGAEARQQQEIRVKKTGRGGDTGIGDSEKLSAPPVSRLASAVGARIGTWRRHFQSL